MGFFRDKVSEIQDAMESGDGARAAEIYHHAASEGDGSYEQNEQSLLDAQREENGR